jgi:hypothetical protein
VASAATRFTKHSEQQQYTTRKEILHMICGKTATKSRALARSAAMVAGAGWLWLAAGLSIGLADSTDVTENLQYSLGVTACDGYSLRAYADIDMNGTWDTMVLFVTIRGNAGVYSGPGQCGGYDYIFSPARCSGSPPWSGGQFAIWFVDMLAAGFNANNPATWVYKSVPGIRLWSDNDWIACTDTASPYYQIMAYTERNQGGTVVYSQTVGTGTTRTDEIRSQDGIKEVFIHTDSCENTLDCVVLLSGSDAEPYMLVTPVGGTANAGGDFTLSATAGGTSPLAYQWQLDGVNVDGATNSSLTLSNLPPHQAGDYRVVVTNLQGSMNSAVATVTVPPALGLALDTLGWTWTTGGGDGWYRTTASSHDGVDSATCVSPGISPPYYQPWMQTTVTGPGTLTFWWIFPATFLTTDYLTFSMDGVEQSRIRMIRPGWSQKTYYVGTGTHTLRWAYLRGGSINGGPARMDEVHFTSGGTAPFITTQPASRQDVVAGTNVVFTVVASGTPPFTYQWRRNGTDLPGATSSSLTLTNVRPNQVGTYSVVVAGGYGSPAISSDALLNVTAIPLPVALDCPSVAWTTSGDENWYGQVGFTQDGTNAAQSGTITHNQQSVMETTVLGPGSVSFWWKVSSETNFDYLRFYIDGAERVRISGEMDWKQLSYMLSPGHHSLRWAYTKDFSVSSGQDAGWVDQVSYVGPPTLSITHLTPAQLKVWWPLPATDWVLAQASPLNGSPTRWLQVPFPYETNGAEISMSLQPTAGVHGYRLFYWPREGAASGTVSFVNNASTAISNRITMARLPVGTRYRVALYFTWDTGSSNVVPADSEFVQVGDAVNIGPAAGMFGGGTRTTPVMVPGGFGWFQVRAWEAEVCSTVFATFEAVDHAPPGCMPSRGVSNKIRADTGDPNVVPAENPASLINWGLRGFYITPDWCPGCSQ